MKHAGPLLVLTLTLGVIAVPAPAMTAQSRAAQAAPHVRVFEGTG